MEEIKNYKCPFCGGTVYEKFFYIYWGSWGTPYSQAICPKCEKESTMVDRTEVKNKKDKNAWLSHIKEWVSCPKEQEIGLL